MYFRLIATQNTKIISKSFAAWRFQTFLVSGFWLRVLSSKNEHQSTLNKDLQSTPAKDNANDKFNENNFDNKFDQNSGHKKSHSLFKLIKGKNK